MATGIRRDRSRRGYDSRTEPGQVRGLGGPPERFEEPIAFAFPDFENGFVVLINTSRESVCTEQQVQYEEDVLAWDADHLDDFFAWIDAGNDPAEFEPQPPELVPFPDGDQLVSVKQITTGKGAIVEQVRGRDLGIEIWQLDEGAPGVGPCLDTATSRASISAIAATSPRPARRPA